MSPLQWAWVSPHVSVLPLPSVSRLGLFSLIIHLTNRFPVAVVAVVLILILRRRKQQQMAAQQQNGMRPYDLEGGNLPAAEVNASQSTVNNAYRYKTSMDSVPI